MAFLRNIFRPSTTFQVDKNQPLWFPKWMADYAVLAYAAIVFAIVLLFNKHLMALYNWILSFFGVLIFFYFSHKLSRDWRLYPTNTFVKYIFWFTIVLRLIWILFFSQFTYWLWDTPWEQPEGTSMDSYAYYDTAVWYTTLIDEGRFWEYLQQSITSSGVSDLGYPVYLTCLSIIGLESIIWTRIPNCIFEAVVCIMVYRIGRRHFGEDVGRLGAIFTMLMPLTFMYAGITMKESMMIMLMMLAVNQLDQIIQGEKKGLWQVLLGLALVASIAFFRTSLCLVMIAAFLLGLILSESKRSKWVNRLFVFLLIIVVGLLFAGEALDMQMSELEAGLEMSEGNFENRSRGNALVQNMNKAMFAPLIFTVPFPTMVEIPGQSWQQMCAGGNFIKNILSFFVIILFFMLLFQRKWRPHTFPIAVLCGYLLALTMSSFAHSGRFHGPAVPLELMFAAAGLYLYPRECKKVWKPILVFELAVIIGWNWFKLKGRGLI